MKVKINGKDSEVVQGISLLDQLKQMAIEPQLVACELNLKVIRRKDYAQTILQPNDELEILRMIGGG